MLISFFLSKCYFLLVTFCSIASSPAHNKDSLDRMPLLMHINHYIMTWCKQKWLTRLVLKQCARWTLHKIHVHSWDWVGGEGVIMEIIERQKIHHLSFWRHGVMALFPWHLYSCVFFHAFSHWGEFRVVNADDKLKMLNCQNILSFLLFFFLFYSGRSDSLSVPPNTHIPSTL